MKLIHKVSSPFTHNNPFVLGCTNNNDFYPLYATLERNRLMSNHITARGKRNKLRAFSRKVSHDIDHYFYNKPFIRPQIPSISTCKLRTTEEDLIKDKNGVTQYRVFNSLIANFQTYRGFSIYNFTVEGITHSLQVGGGYLASRDNKILLILATKTVDRKSTDGTLNYNHLLNAESGEIYSPSSIRLFVSTELMINPIYKNLYKKLDKEIINPLYQSKIDVMFTTSENIEIELFKNSLDLSFRDLDSMSSFLSNEVIDYTIPVISEELVTKAINDKINHLLFYHEILDDYTQEQDSIYLINFIRSKLSIDEIEEQIRLNQNIFSQAYSRLISDEIATFSYPLSIYIMCGLNLIKFGHINRIDDLAAMDYISYIKEHIEDEDIQTLYNEGTVDLKDYAETIEVRNTEDDFDNDDGDF